MAVMICTYYFKWSHNSIGQMRLPLNGPYLTETLSLLSSAYLCVLHCAQVLTVAFVDELMWNFKQLAGEVN